jgi:hypothetical protein
VRKLFASFCAIYFLTMLILPRQARDKHRKNPKKDKFLQGVRLVRRGLLSSCPCCRSDRAEQRAV